MLNDSNLNSIKGNRMYKKINFCFFFKKKMVMLLIVLFWYIFCFNNLCNRLWTLISVYHLI